MAFDAILAGKIRQALAHIPNVEEKKMFRGIAFMVNDKMCVTVGGNEMMCRIDPDIHDVEIKRKGCSSVIMKGREYRGWVLISSEGLKLKNDFNYWINLALAFNQKAKSSKRKKANV